MVAYLSQTVKRILIKRYLQEANEQTSTNYVNTDKKRATNKKGSPKKGPLGSGADISHTNADCRKIENSTQTNRAMNIYGTHKAGTKDTVEIQFTHKSGLNSESTHGHESKQTPRHMQHVSSSKRSKKHQVFERPGVLFPTFWPLVAQTQHF